MNKKERTVVVFHAPKELYEQTKLIAEREGQTISTICRESLLAVVTDYNNRQLASDSLSV